MSRGLLLALLAGCSVEGEDPTPVWVCAPVVVCEVDLVIDADRAEACGPCPGCVPFARVEWTPSSAPRFCAADLAEAQAVCEEAPPVTWEAVDALDELLARWDAHCPGAAAPGDLICLRGHPIEVPDEPCHVAIP